MTQESNRRNFLVQFLRTCSRIASALFIRTSRTAAGDHKDPSCPCPCYLFRASVSCRGTVAPRRFCERGVRSREQECGSRARRGSS